MGRAGAKATADISLPEGTLHGQEASKVDYFRKLGLAVTIKDSALHLNEPYVVCTTGSELSPDQCAVLKQMGIQMALFRISVQCSWSDGKFAEGNGTAEMDDE